MDSTPSKSAMLIVMTCVMCGAGMLIVVSGQPLRQSTKTTPTPIGESHDTEWLDAFDRPQKDDGPIRFADESDAAIMTLKEKFRTSNDPYVRSGEAEASWMIGSVVTVRRKWVKSIDGVTVDVLMLFMPSCSIPGSDFSMAVLVVNGRIKDWKSCSTYNRSGMQEIMVEDVDGDGFSDVSFRYKDGMWGAGDKRIRTHPGEKRRWIYAYQISSKRFVPLFSELKRTVTLNSQTKTVNGLGVRIVGLPKSVCEHKVMLLSAEFENLSTQQIQLSGFPRLHIDGSGYSARLNPISTKLLEPNQKATVAIELMLSGFRSQKVTVTAAIDSRSIGD